MIYQSHDIPVQGGQLHVGVWGNRGPILLCSHGLSANHKSYQGLARELDGEFTLIAVDHRGRGKSCNITGPWGMKAHADDLAATLDFLKIDAVPLLMGHSMGAFISAVTHHHYGDRIGKLLFIDGGLPLADELPPGITPEQLVTAVVGPSMDRLDKLFASEDEFLQFWKHHPALGECWSADLEEYLLYELSGSAPELRSCVNKAAILGDTESQLMSDDIPNALAKLSVPVTFLQAPRGIMNEAPLYSSERLQDMQKRLPQMKVEVIDDVNHYSILLGEKGAAAIADIVRKLV